MAGAPGKVNVPAAAGPCNIYRAQGAPSPLKGLKGNVLLGPLIPAKRKNRRNRLVMVKTQ